MNDNKLNLASARFGAVIVDFTDEFFAACERMLTDSEPQFIADKYDSHGKWMDGWETRRRRHGGHDTAIVKLAFEGRVSDIDIDTRHFTGNFPPEAAVEACYCKGIPEEADWFSLIERRAIKGDSQNLIAVNSDKRVNYIRLHIYPDGGVARLRVYGNVAYEPPSKDARIEVSGLGFGGQVLTYNDAHYGNVQSLLAPDRAKNMGDGWETRRRRTPGHDWLILSTSLTSVIEAIEVDTAYYKGNYPAECSLQAAHVADSADLQKIIKEAENWQEILPCQELSPDNIHKFENNMIATHQGCNYFRLNIYPDGGIARLRLFGKCQ